MGRSRTYALYETWQRALGYPDLLEMYESHVGKRPNLREPLTFGEKLTWLKLHDRNPLLPVITDKATAREWIAQRVGSEMLVPLVGVYKSASAINTSELPRQFIAKLNNGSGRNLIIWDKAAVDWDAFRRTLDGWLREPQIYRLMEWYQHQNPPRVVVEHLLVGSGGVLPVDYKILVLGGKIRLIHAVRDRLAKIKITLYGRDWQPLRVTVDDKPSAPEPPPVLLDRMIETAEILGRGFPLMRVDTYCHDGRVYVGELTPHPYSGMCRLSPSSFDLELGGCLDLAPFRGRYWEKMPPNSMSHD